MAIVDLRSVEKDYPLGKTVVRALRGVDLAIRKGEFSAIAGPSGSGKTTLLNLVGCVDTSTRGTVEVAGEDTARFRIEVGYVHGVKPGNIVGAIANVAGLQGRQIGHVDIREDHTYVGLPQGLPDLVMRQLKKTRVAGQPLRIAPAGEVPPKSLRKPPRRPPGPKRQRS